jgi:acetylornithine deacetylase/succinyl-diaminopimelate desuccinylase-like protein
VPTSERDLELIQALPNPEPWLRETFGVQEFIGGKRGNDLYSGSFLPTCNICGISGGYQDAGSKTVIPARTFAKVDFRLVPEQDPYDIFNKLQEHLKTQGFADVEAKMIEAPMYPYKSAADDPLYALSARTGEEVYGKSSRTVPMVGGSSPVYAFAKPLGNIPVISPGLGYWDNRTHSPDEHIRIGDFLNAARQLARILNEFGDL